MSVPALHVDEFTSLEDVTSWLLAHYQVREAVLPEQEWLHLRALLQPVRTLRFGGCVFVRGSSESKEAANVSPD